MTFTIPRSTLVSIRPDGPYTPWRAHTMRQTVTGEVVGGRGGAVVVRVEGWLILTREIKGK